MKYIKILIHRVKSKTPKLFRRIRNLCVILAVASAAAVSTYSSLDQDIKQTIPVQYIKVLGITAISAAFLSQLTKENNSKNK